MIATLDLRTSLEVSDHNKHSYQLRGVHDSMPGCVPMSVLDVRVHPCCFHVTPEHLAVFTVSLYVLITLLSGLYHVLHNHNDTLYLDEMVGSADKVFEMAALEKWH